MELINLMPTSSFMFTFNPERQANFTVLLVEVCFLWAKIFLFDMGHESYF